mmetsp:Transcript_50433/g.131020  ORF Transcript_50433/g.131020 Transcript_50433/m.131020 type:complete len:211 (-) Transcript_50433:141-773(-)
MAPCSSRTGGMIGQRTAATGGGLTAASRTAACRMQSSPIAREPDVHSRSRVPSRCKHIHSRWWAVDSRCSRPSKGVAAMYPLSMMVDSVASRGLPASAKLLQLGQSLKTESSSSCSPATDSRKTSTATSSLAEARTVITSACCTRTESVMVFPLTKVPVELKFLNTSSASSSTAISKCSGETARRSVSSGSSRSQSAAGCAARPTSSRAS